MTRKPTENGEAYLAFVQAHNFHREVEDLPKLRQAEQLYERALQLDPNFALAAASYSRLESWIYHTYEPTAEYRDKSRSLANRSLQLQPDLPEGHLALGFSIYYVDKDYARALAELAIAQKGLPNEAEVYLSIGAIQRRQGKWDESNASLEKAVSLSPNEIWPIQNLVLNYQMQRRFDDANKLIDRALKLAPQSFSVWEIKAQLEMSENGTFETVERGVKALSTRSMSESDRARFLEAVAQTRLLQRRYAEVLEILNGISDGQLAGDTEGMINKYGAIGIAKKCMGDAAGAREAFLKTKEFAQKWMNEAPNEAKRHEPLAQVLAWLGEKDAAIAEAKRATELVPESVDAFDGPVCTERLAEVYAIVGEHEKAIELLDGLLTRPTQVTVANLRISPLMDPLREDPNFIAMIKRHGG
jgi:tetratricopeptide (TPR) repeat protein